MMSTDTDTIRKTAVLKAPLARVWEAISDSQQFGAWFGAEIDGPFVAGTELQAKIRPTTVDPEVARLQEPHAGTPFVVAVEQVEPQRRLSFRWHPGGVMEGPMTLVEFALEEVPGGTQLTITESGFDQLPLERRADALAGNAEGWTHQLQLVAGYLAQPA
jgi:uncharacterized protein YndB with AHSA1/START domain